MHTIELFATAIRSEIEEIGLPCEPVEEICAITGKKMLCIPRKHVISDGFTNQTLLQDQTSPYMSIDAFRAFKYRPERSSWFINQVGDKITFKRLKRSEMREIVINYITIPGQWACYASTTGKKHGALYAKLNEGQTFSEAGACIDKTADNSAYFAMDGDIIHCKSYRLLIDWYIRLDRYLRLGIGRNYLKSGTVNMAVIKSAGAKTGLEFKRWAADKYRSLLYKFLIYLLPSQEELKAELKALNREIKPEDEHRIVSVKPVEIVRNFPAGQMSLFN